MSTTALSPISAIAPDELGPSLTIPPIPAPPAPTAADYRLVIEEGEASGSFVYKTIDRRTGEVIQELPRDTVLNMRNDAAYSAGTLHDAQY